MKQIFVLIFHIFIVGVSYCQTVPTDNPYLTRYPNAVFQNHWTDTISWNKVLKANSVSGLLQTTAKPDSFIVNLVTLNSKVDSLSGPGGVLFFPAGKYYFSDNLYLRSRVVIRGVASVIADAKVEGFAPLTKFIFPKYISGAARSTAFKEITADTFGISKAGLVDIDINRAVISFYGGGYTTNLCGKTYAQPQARFLSEKIILMGLRQNNAATPDPRMPNANQISFGATATSQVWPGINGSCMNINVAKQCVISNCRINDETGTGDNFVQPAYKLQNNAAIPNEAYTTFNFKHQNGISLNFYKLSINGHGNILSGPHGKHGMYSSKRYANPDEEPLLFGTELEVRDNWVKTLTGAKIMASGLNLLIHNNVLSDDTVNKTYYINRSGIRAEISNGATFGNAGILFSGWDVKITDNTILSTSGSMLAASGFKSVDGESILVEISYPTTTSNGVSIENNKIHSKSNRGITIWAQDNFNKIRISKNDFGRKEVNFFGSCSGLPACPLLNGLQIDSNYNVSSISAGGSFRGTQCQNYISRNEFLPGASVGITMPDLMEIKPDNILNGRSINSVVSNSDPGKVLGKLEGPQTDTTIYVCPNLGGAEVRFLVNVECNFADSVVFYNNTQCGLQRVNRAQSADGFHFIYNYPVNPAYGTATEYFVAKVFSGGYTNTDWTNTRAIKKICTTNVLDKVQKQEITLIPNPTESTFKIQGISPGDIVSVLNGLGQLLGAPMKVENSENIFNLDNFKPGIYFVTIAGKGSIKLMKK